MTRDEIIRMARESKLVPAVIGNTKSEYFGYVERFAALVAAAERKDALKTALLKAKKITKMAVFNEREACARECDLLQGSGENSDKWTITRVKAFHDAAEAIRARGKS